MAAERIGSAEYQLGVDLKPLKAGLTSAEGSIRQSGVSMEKAYGKQGVAAANKLAQSQGLLVRQSSELRKGILAGVGLGGGILAFNMLKNAVSGVVNGVGDAVMAAAEEEAAIAQLTRAIEENDAAWDGNVEAIEAVIDKREQLAFSDDEQRESLRQLVAVTKDVDQALYLQGVAMDFARLKGMDLVTAGTMLGKVYAGNLGSLSRYGIVLRKGATATEALAEIQKRAAGQAEEYADGAIGAVERMNIEFANATESLGALLTPLATDLALAAADVATALADAFAPPKAPQQAFRAWAETMRNVKAEAEEMGASVKDVSYDLGSFEDIAADTPLGELQPHLKEAVLWWREYGAEARRAGLSYYGWRAVFFDLKDDMGLGAEQASRLTLEWIRAQNAAGDAARATENLAGRQQQLAIEYGLASAAAGEYTMTEEEQTEAAAKLAASIERMATVSFPELQDAFKDTRKALDDAFHTDSLKELEREEKVLERARRRAIRLRQGDALAIAETQLAENRRLQDAARDAQRHANQEHRRQQQRKTDLDAIQTELGVSKTKAHELYQQVTKDYTLDLLINDQQLDQALTKMRALVALAAGSITAAIPWLASGGDTKANQAYLVGEEGPELWVEKRPGYMLDARATARALAPAARGGSSDLGGGTTNVHVHVNAGAFLGLPEDAQRLGRLLAPPIVRELKRLSLQP